jgi:hypothetical protein
MGAQQSGLVRGVWRVGPSRIHGNGVILQRAVRPGAMIGVGIGYRWGGWLPSITSDFGAWINHSDTPSASLLKLNGNHWVVANRALAPGDEITLDYRRTPWFVRRPEPHFVNPIHVNTIH